MTIPPEAPALNAPVNVRFTKAGIPLAVRYDGKIWAVAAEPYLWYLFSWVLTGARLLPQASCDFRTARARVRVRRSVWLPGLFL